MQEWLAQRLWNECSISILTITFNAKQYNTLHCGECVCCGSDRWLEGSQLAAAGQHFPELGGHLACVGPGRSGGLCPAEALL